MMAERTKCGTAGGVRRLARLARAFRRREDGVAAIEFAMIATPFFALLFAILETALVFFVSQVVETGVEDAARLVRTGQAQKAMLDETSFHATLCGKILNLFDCEERLKLDVRVLSSFADPLPSPLDASGNLQTNFVYEPGVRGDIVVVRAFLPWPTFVPGLGNDLRNMADGSHLIAAARAFRNEPF
jgi:Flp pilus assembly protein TadG